MSDAVYRIVEHDGGWAYKLGDVFSETFPSRRLAELAATGSPRSSVAQVRTRQSLGKMSVAFGTTKMLAVLTGRTHMLLRQRRSGNRRQASSLNRGTVAALPRARRITSDRRL